MTDVERLLLENQRIILHGLRIVLNGVGAPPHQFLTMQDAMGRTEQFIRSADEAQRLRVK